MRSKPKAKAAVKTGAVIYTRVSTKEQVSNLSLGTQEAACRVFCEREGLGVDAVFSDQGESAKTTDRTEFNRMLEYCAKNRSRIGAVVVYSVSRFSRNALDHLSVKSALTALGIRLRSVTEALEDTATGRFTEGIVALAAQYDNEVKADRTIVGMKARVGKGRWTHQPPLGYAVDPATSELVLDNERAPLIRKMFEMYSTGTSSKRAVLNEITRLGLRNNRGKVLSPQHVDRILSNPLYSGWISVPKWGMVQQGIHEPIIDRETFQLVQRLAERTQKPAPHIRTSAEFPLRVFARCDVCREPLTGSFSTGRRGTKYPYYFCRSQQCRAVKFTRDDLHLKFAHSLDVLQPDPCFRDLFRVVLKDVWREKTAGKAQSQALLRKQVQKLEARKQEIVEAALSKTLPQNIIDAELAKVETALSNLSQDEAELNADLSDVELTRMEDFSYWVLSNAGMIWFESDAEIRLKLQNALFPTGVMVAPDGVRTASSSSIFIGLDEFRTDKNGLASPGGFEPPLPP